MIERTGQTGGAAAPTPSAGGQPLDLPPPGQTQKMEVQPEVVPVPAQGEQPQALPEEPPPDTSALVLPIGLRGLQRGNVRMVVFAAGDEDYAEAYDGFYIELARD